MNVPAQFLVILVISLIGSSYSLGNDEDIKISSLQQTLGNSLNELKLDFKMVVNAFEKEFEVELPQEYDSLVSVMAILFILSLVFLVILAGCVFGQACFNCCSSPGVEYKASQKGCAKLVTFVYILFLIVTGSLIMYYFSDTSKSAYSVLDTITEETKTIQQDGIDLITSFKTINERYPIEIPENIVDVMKDLTDYTVFYNQFKAEKSTSFWSFLVLYIFVFVLLILMVVAMITNVRGLFLCPFAVIFLILTPFFVISFVGTAGSFGSSYMCTFGIDKNVEVVLDMIKVDKCESEIFQHYTFCDGFLQNTTCDVFTEVDEKLDEGIEILEYKIKHHNNSKNVTLWKETVAEMKKAKLINQDLKSCNSSEVAYRSASTEYCEDFSYNYAILTICAISFTSLLSFFILSTLFTCYRMGAYRSRIRDGFQAIYNVDDHEMATRRPRNMHPSQEADPYSHQNRRNNTFTRDDTMIQGHAIYPDEEGGASITCCGAVFFYLLFAGVFLSSVVLMYVFGMEEYTVPR
eukprot:TRINITY_DN9720_c0_g1_i1.p1 TRINITY_DN9720_c0_g1~~TRINITY_DN9720_c0_g1_i1.p1  ORF type:complete len:521 (-),score=89.47 TRINITY_DN9720_c0_g1_i1:51-1613(-)